MCSICLVSKRMTGQRKQTNDNGLLNRLRDLNGRGITPAIGDKAIPIIFFGRLNAFVKFVLTEQPISRFTFKQHRQAWIDAKICFYILRRTLGGNGVERAAVDKRLSLIIDTAKLATESIKASRDSTQRNTPCLISRNPIKPRYCLIKIIDVGSSPYLLSRRLNFFQRS